MAEAQSGGGDEWPDGQPHPVDQRSNQATDDGNDQASSYPSDEQHGAQRRRGSAGRGHNSQLTGGQKGAGPDSGWPLDEMEYRREYRKLVSEEFRDDEQEQNQQGWGGTEAAIGGSQGH